MEILARMAIVRCEKRFSHLDDELKKIEHAENFLCEQMPERDDESCQNRDVVEPDHRRPPRNYEGRLIFCSELNLNKERCTACSRNTSCQSRSGLITLYRPPGISRTTPRVASPTGRRWPGLWDISTKRLHRISNRIVAIARRNMQILPRVPDSMYANLLQNYRNELTCYPETYLPSFVR